MGPIIGKDGTFLIDDQYAPLTDKIVATVKSVGGDVSKFRFNTPYYSDHTGGNENTGRGGTLIFSQDNVRKRLFYGSVICALGMRTGPAAKGALPVVTFSDDISFYLHGDLVRAIHLPLAHTDGDSFIHFTSANTIHAGIIFFTGFSPFIDGDHGGLLKGMIDSADKVLSLSDNIDKSIPGHGPLGNKAQLLAYRQMLSTTNDRLKS